MKPKWAKKIRLRLWSLIRLREVERVHDGRMLFGFGDHVPSVVAICFVFSLHTKVGHFGVRTTCRRAFVNGFREKKVRSYRCAYKLYDERNRFRLFALSDGERNKNSALICFFVSPFSMINMNKNRPPFCALTKSKRERERAKITQVINMVTQLKNKCTGPYPHCVLCKRFASKWASLVGQ